MRMSEIIMYGIGVAKFAAFILAFILLFWGIGYKLIYKRGLKGKQELKLSKVASYGILMMVVIIICGITLLRGIGAGGNSVIIPLYSYKQAWYQFNLREWRNLILNICMFVPFGFMLPLAFEKFRIGWKTYIFGFGFSMLIEILQLVLKIGIFETDDLINNMLGTMIGYGLFSIALCIKDKKYNKKVFLYQIPLIITVVAFCIIFGSYYAKDLGNLVYENTSKHKMPKLKKGKNISISSDESSVEIYKMETASLDETHKFAEKIFDIQDKKIDENRTDIYDDTVVYYSDDGFLNLWIDYKGMTARYTNFELSFPGDGRECKYLLGADEQTVRGAIEKVGFNVPKETSFKVKENDYSFEIKREFINKNYYTGLIVCSLNEKRNVVNIDYNLVVSEPYKKMKIISPQKAYDILSRGVFYSDELIKTDLPYTVKSMEIVYIADSKGFYQPVYEFVLDNERDKEIHINIVAKK